ncbi:hypothetical protein [Candidatus Viridilinea mediisalina]|uniref:hypothetical protein n=1 Tax=Candidatus Viridilinea mediisalina TaxID=2024553 RepID=UPI0013FD45DD|nr:hypothetical protein [Candidatus Viridilinea mediisalina]
MTDPNMFPALLLGVMFVLTLILLPLLDEERLRRQHERQPTDKLRLPLADE